MGLAVIEPLAAEVDRLVWAGALAARGDAGLAALEESLRIIGAQVPALGKTAGLIAKLQGGASEDSGAALLALNGAVQQLRATQLRAAAPEGDLVPMPGARESLRFRPTPVKVLYVLNDALASKKKPPGAVEALLRGSSVAGDPRLWPMLVEGLGHAYLRETVVELVGSIGPPILPVLESAFSMKGKAADGARLRAIGAIRGPEGESLYRKCLARGSKDVRAAALGCLGFLGAALEPLVLEGYESATSDDQREVFAPALAGVGTERSLRQLLDLGTRRPASCAHALEQLGEEAFPRLLSIARETLSSSSSFARCESFRAFLVRRDARRNRTDALPFLGELLRHPDLTVRSGTADLLLEHPDPAAAAMLWEIGGQDPEIQSKAVLAIFRLGEKAAYEALEPLAPSPRAQKSGGFLSRVTALLAGSSPRPTQGKLDPRLVHAVYRLSDQSDPRWLDVLVDLIGADTALATHGLVKLRDPRAVEPLVALARSGGVPGRHAVSALGELEARAATSALCELLGKNPGRDEAVGLLTALTRIRDPEAGPAIQRYLARRDIDSFQKQCAETALHRMGIA